MPEILTKPISSEAVESPDPAAGQLTQSPISGRERPDFDDAYSEFRGLLFIGDPHVASRAPGFRKDDYPRVILAKLNWAIHYAVEHRLLPVLLGDLFECPRDNANWLIVELLELFAGCPGGYVSAVYGNHDCKENAIGDNDTLSVLIAAGHVRLLDRSPWRGRVNGCEILVGGTSWNQPLPDAIDRSSLAEAGLVFWVAHHDLRFPGNEANAKLSCRAIDGIDVVVNGHIHCALADSTIGKTCWINPGNIARIKRDDATRRHQPGVLRIDIAPDGSWRRQQIPVPFQPFDEVFFASTASAESSLDESVFIKELASLESIRTAGGAGLRAFLDRNISQFDRDVAAEINSLAAEVLQDAH